MIGPRGIGDTVRHLNELGATHQVLQPWYDVDEIDDLQRLLDELQHQECDIALSGLRRELAEAITRT